MRRVLANGHSRTAFRAGLFYQATCPCSYGRVLFTTPSRPGPACRTVLISLAEEREGQSPLLPRSFLRRVRMVRVVSFGVVVNVIWVRVLHVINDGSLVF